MRFFDVNSSEKVRRMISLIGADPKSVDIMAPKARTYAILIKNVKSRDANIIKQGMLSAGADAACAKGVIDCSVDKSDVLLFGTVKQFTYFAENAKKQTSIIRNIALSIKKFNNSDRQSSSPIIGIKRKRPLVMGILNVTPDSFSDEGKFFNIDDAISHAKQMIDDGADIIDVGGESTRPGSSAVLIDEQIRRVVPVIGAIRKFSSLPISIDAKIHDVAEAAIKAGANIINDISAVSDDKMADLSIRYDLPIIIMHMKGIPENMQEKPYYDDCVEEITDFLRARSDYLIGKGVKRDKIIIDPGIGFGKRIKDNLAIINNLENFKQLSFPILIGLSRKSFLGTLTGDDVDDREAQTLIANFMAVEHGADIIRVHNVKNHIKARAVFNAVNLSS